MAYIFLDESGEFKKHNGDKYFVVGSFITGSQRRTAKGFRSWQRTKFPRKMRVQSEVKFSEVKIDKKLRLNTLKNISDLDVRIHYSYLLRSNIPNEFKYKTKLKDGHLYTQIIAETLESYLPLSDLEFRIFCDKRHLKGIKQSEFRDRISIHFRPLLPKNAIIQVEMIDSTTNANIQIADWIAGSIAWYLEKKPLGKECFQLLKNNILGDGLELFKDQWDFSNNQKTQT